MPNYDYHCEANGLIIEITHPMDISLKTWGDLCELIGMDAGDTPADAPISKVFLKAPMANTPVGNSALKNWGFTRLEKRDDGVYENVTRTGTESRYYKAGQPETMPHLHKKISD